MSSESQNLEGPDLTAGIPMDPLADGVPLRGHVDGEAVIVVRRGDDVYAIGATCSHYGGPLADGLVVDDTVRCPWHHACFSLRTGEALRAPALNPVPSWKVERRGDRVYVTEKAERAPLAPASLRARDLEVHVVAPEARPFERILGPDMGDFIRALHEERGVIFHLEQTATAIGERAVTLKNGELVSADLVVIGAGVRPSLALAERAGLATHP